MKIPNFKSEEGSILYQNTVGKVISPGVANVLLSHVKPYLEIPTTHTLFDLGCGPGTLCLPIARDYPHLDVTAVDASEAMVALAMKEAESQGLDNIRFLQMDADHIALAPNSCDLVLCNLAFPFFARPHESMREVFSVVQPGGWVFFTVPGRNTWDEFFSIAESVLGNMVSMARPFLTKFSQAEVLPAAIGSAGFTQVTESRTRLPFHFENGQAVMAFFGELFHLLDYATPDMKSDLAVAIDQSHPGGFTMHYEVVLISGRRPE